MKTIKFLKINLLIFIYWLMLLQANIAYSQTNEIKPCGTLPVNFKDSIVLKYYLKPNQLDSVYAAHYFKNLSLGKQVNGSMLRGSYIIPIRIHIVRNNAGTNAIEPEEAFARIDKLNQLYKNNNSNIQFYAKAEVHYVTNQTYYNDPSDGDVFDMQMLPESDCINVHFIHNSGSFAGVYTSIANSCVISMTNNIGLPNKGCMINGATLAHEIGHVLGLEHPHRGSTVEDNADETSPCDQEAVDRNTTFNYYCQGAGHVCITKGDELCDTEASPKLSDSKVNTLTGQYIGGGHDLWYDNWHPQTNLVMSYTPDNLRTTFTPQQMGIMLGAAGFLSQMFPGMFNNRYVDTNEPDNLIGNARPIHFEEKQRHSFHQELQTFAGNIVSAFEFDEDWLTFDNTIDGIPIYIKTSAIIGLDPDTWLGLYDSNHNLIASNDNISSTNLYSSIYVSSLPIGTYFIKVSKNFTATIPYNSSIGARGYFYNISLNYDEDCSSISYLNGVTSLNAASSDFNLGCLVPNSVQSTSSIINVSDNTGFYVNANSNLFFNNSASSNQYPLNNSTMNLTFCNQSKLTVDNQGYFVLGGYPRKAFVNFSAGSELRIKKNGTIVINHDSKITIEAGAKLIFENGANIALLGSSAQIIVKPGGQIIVAPNATFNYTGAGFITFETAAGNTVPYVTASGLTARFMLNSGSIGNKSKKLLQVTGGQTANIDPSLYLFAVLNGNISLDANARINVLSKSQMQNVDIVASTPNSPANRHRGMVFNGNGESIYNVSVSDAITGITALNYYGGADIYLSQFWATRCGTALQIFGKGASIYSATINNCDVGIYLDKMDRQTYLYNPNITVCKKGIFGSENNLNVIELDQPYIYNNIYGLDAFKTRFTARCGIICNNSSNTPSNRNSYQGANVWLRTNSNLFLDPNLRPSSGSIEMRNIRALSILQDKSEWISPQLAGGRNNLWTPIDYSIYGTVADKNILSGANINKASTLNVWNFAYTSAGWTSVAPVYQVDYDVKYTALGNNQLYNILYYDNNPLAGFQSCYKIGFGGTNPGDVGGTNTRFTGSISQSISPIADLPITNATPSGQVVHTKITDAYNYYFSEGANYYESVNAFKDALGTTFTATDMELWTDAIHIIDAQMVEALSMGLADKSIEKYDASGTSYSQSILDVLAIQDKLLSDYVGDATSLYKINTMKAYIHRMLSDRTTCLEILNGITSTTPDDYTLSHARAICQITNEQNYINGTITLDDLDAVSCIEPNNIEEEWQPYISEELPEEFILNKDTTSVTNLSNMPVKLFPNPSNSGITTLHFYSEPGVNYEINMYDVLGRKLIQLNGITEKENNVNLNIADMPAGSYMVKLSSNKITRTKNLIITK